MNAPPPARSQLIFTLAIVGGSIWALQTLAGIYVLLMIVPKHEQIFRDFGVELPGITRALIFLSQSLRADNPGQRFSLLWPGIVLWLIAVAGATYLCSRHPRAWPAATFLVLAVLSWALGALATLIALQLPLSSMTRSLQGGA